MEAALQKYCLPPGMELPEGRFDQIETEYGIVAARGANAGETNKWYNHIPSTQVKSQLPPEIWNSYTKFCNIRNPWDKVVSFFHFRDRDLASRPENEIFAEFRKFLQPDSNSGRYRIGIDTHIYFVDGKPAMDDYIRYDNLTEDYAHICNKLGIENTELPRLKTASRGKKKIDYRKYYDDDLRDTVAKIFEKEIDVFGWKF